MMFFPQCTRTGAEKHNGIEVCSTTTTFSKKRACSESCAHMLGTSFLDALSQHNTVCIVPDIFKSRWIYTKLRASPSQRVLFHKTGLSRVLHILSTASIFPFSHLILVEYTQIEIMFQSIGNCGGCTARGCAADCRRSSFETFRVSRSISSAALLLFLREMSAFGADPVVVACIAVAEAVLSSSVAMLLAECVVWNEWQNNSSPTTSFLKNPLFVEFLW